MSQAEATIAMNRKTGRIKLFFPCEIKGSKETLKVPVRDVSLDGIKLATSESHTAGQTLQITLLLPTRLTLSAEIRWVEHDAAKSLYVLGCQFAHSGDSRQSLKDTLSAMASAIDSSARRVK